jgi:hypothetical protein
MACIVLYLWKVVQYMLKVGLCVWFCFSLWFLYVWPRSLAFVYEWHYSSQLKSKRHNLIREECKNFRP